MRPEDLHREQARANRELARRLLSVSLGLDEWVTAQWALIAAFYCSVQAIDAYFLETLGRRPHGHPVRFNWLAQYAPPDVYEAHFRLHQYSERARYEARRYQHHFVTDTVLPLLTTTTTWARLPEA